ncbi:helix-turn-helix transcriptional regulator [bacterium]|nr:helix-turn-helix transcriptional regulator [bacterium]
MDPNVENNGSSGDLQKRTPREKAFLHSVVQIIDNCLQDPGFTVENLSREAGYSRSQLHRRLKSITGHSTSHLILSRRLLLAKKLLKEAPLSVAQIAQQSGFGTHSYFTMCFRKVYGITPSGYVRQS